MTSLSLSSFSKVGNHNTTDNLVAGRLKYFTEHWKQLTADEFILESVKGYKIEFRPDASLEHNWSRRPETKFNLQDQEKCVIDNEIIKLVSKRVIKLTHHCEGEFISQSLLDLKKMELTDLF